MTTRTERRYRRLLWAYPRSYRDHRGTEILTTLIPERPGRIYPRAVSKPISPYPSRRVRPGPISQHAHYTLTTTTPATPASTHTSQDKHPKSQHSKPLLSSWHCAYRGLWAPGPEWPPAPAYRTGNGASITRRRAELA